MPVRPLGRVGLRRGTGPLSPPALRSDDLLAGLGADQPLLDREHRAPRRAAAAASTTAQQPDLDARAARPAASRTRGTASPRARRRARGGRRTSAARRGPRSGSACRATATRCDVLLEHHRRRQRAARVAHALEEPLRVGEQLVGRQRDLLPAHDVLVVEVEARVGPQQELVERRLAVDQPDLRRGDLAVIEPDLAAPQAADQREHRAAAERGERAHEREHAGGLGEAADEVGALRRPAGPRSSRPIVTTSRRYAGCEHDLVGARGLGVGRGATPRPANTIGASIGRSSSTLRACADQLEGRAVGAADHDQAGVAPSGSSSSRGVGGDSATAPGRPRARTPSWICRPARASGSRTMTFESPGMRRERVCSINADEGLA